MRSYGAAQRQSVMNHSRKAQKKEWACTHSTVEQKLPQHCKSTILHFKKKSTPRAWFTAKHLEMPIWGFLCSCQNSHTRPGALFPSPSPGELHEFFSFPLCHEPH